VALWVGNCGDPMGVGVSYEQGTPVEAAWCRDLYYIRERRTHAGALSLAWSLEAWGLNEGLFCAPASQGDLAAFVQHQHARHLRDPGHDAGHEGGTR